MIDNVPGGDIRLQKRSWRNLDVETAGQVNLSRKAKHQVEVEDKSDIEAGQTKTNGGARAEEINGIGSSSA